MLALLVTGPADAAPRCRNTGSFDAWMAAFKKEATSQGISQRAISAALDGMTFDPAIIRRDSGQGVFQQSFLQFAGRMTAVGRYQNGLKQLKAHAALLSRIEEATGVPPPVVVALWGLESDYGAYKGGTYNVIRSVATLAYDCRRPAFFRDQLMGVLRIVERGDLRADQMIGNWAGELGPTQFTPADYFKHGLDFDGDGKVDMINSLPDALASAANLMKSLGWQKGQPWLQEVRVPAQMPWQESGLDIQHPRSQWAKWGRHGGSGQACGRQSAGIADPAHGPSWPGVPRLSELQGLHRMERRHRLSDHGGLFRRPACGRPGDQSGQRPAGGAYHRADRGIAALGDARRPARHVGGPAALPEARGDRRPRARHRPGH